MSEKVQLHQLFDSTTSTYTYILADTGNGRALILDPVLEKLDRDCELLRELDLKLELVLETHIHADHVTGASQLKALTGCQIGAAAVAGATGVDLPLVDGQILKIGAIQLKVISTPGHTDSCLSFLGHGYLFTGDALMIRKVGRTDFQQGSAKKLYESITQKIWTLPDETVVLPAHDYQGLTRSTIGDEKKWNSRIKLGTTLEHFVEVMGQLKLAPPQKIKEAVPANMRMGGSVSSGLLKVKMGQSGPEVSVEETRELIGKPIVFVDVRRPDEYVGELGHIEGARLVTLGPDLMRFLNDFDRSKEIVFICRSGARSGQATALSKDLGFNHTANMVGGMLRWNELGFPVVRTAP